jgi:transcriptional regulator with XRE-family HTH domain
MLGNQLKEYRKKKGYTQKEAADVLGVVLIIMQPCRI